MMFVSRCLLGVCCEYVGYECGIYSVGSLSVFVNMLFGSVLFRFGRIVGFLLVVCVSDVMV